MATINDGLNLARAEKRLAELIGIEEQYERAYRVAERRHNAAFRYIDGRAEVDGRPYSMNEYRYFASLAREADSKLSIVRGKVDAMRATVDSLKMRVYAACDGDRMVSV